MREARLVLLSEERDDGFLLGGLAGKATLKVEFVFGISLGGRLVGGDAGVLGFDITPRLEVIYSRVVIVFGIFDSPSGVHVASVVEDSLVGNILGVGLSNTIGLGELGLLGGARSGYFGAAFCSLAHGTVAG